MLNGSGVGVTIAANRKNRNTAIRHQLSSFRALTTPATLSISRISGNSKPAPKSSITPVTNSK